MTLLRNDARGQCSRLPRWRSGSGQHTYIQVDTWSQSIRTVCSGTGAAVEVPTRLVVRMLCLLMMELLIPVAGSRYSGNSIQRERGRGSGRRRMRVRVEGKAIVHLGRMVSCRVVSCREAIRCVEVLSRTVTGHRGSESLAAAATADAGYEAATFSDGHAPMRRKTTKRANSAFDDSISMTRSPSVRPSLAPSSPDAGHASGYDESPRNCQQLAGTSSAPAQCQVYFLRSSARARYPSSECKQARFKPTSLRNDDRTTWWVMTNGGPDNDVT